MLKKTKIICTLGPAVDNEDMIRSLIRTGMDVRALAPWQLIWPGILLAATMLCIQLLGDSLRDALDPKLRR